MDCGRLGNRKVIHCDGIQICKKQLLRDEPDEQKTDYSLEEDKYDNDAPAKPAHDPGQQMMDGGDTKDYADKFETFDSSIGVRN